MSPTPALDDEDLAAIDDRLAADDTARLSTYPGPRTDRQPVHTVYVPADRVDADLMSAWGVAATEALARNAPTAENLAQATGLPADEVRAVWGAVTAKLVSEPIEDLRVDLEDGYGSRPDDEEDRHAIAAGRVLATMVSAGAAPPFLGIRFKSLEGATRRRGLRTLDLAIGSLLAGGGAALPTGFVVTLPKVTSIAQVGAMVDICERLEQAYALADGTLRFEIQVETPQAILLGDGTAGVAAMVHAAAGRCTGLHFGTYDYTAGLGISGGYQAMDHPAADHAKAVMQVAAAQTGVTVSDGSTNVLPVGEREQVHAAWALHARLVRRSLERGFYQGWDLHPAQLPTRFLSTYLFFRTDLDAIGGRLTAYLSGAVSDPGGTPPDLPGAEGVLDEPATAQALAAFLLRGVHCGAVATDEAEALTGASLATITALASRRLG